MLVAFYKKRGPTSREVVNEIKKLLNEKKIGHAGTLDPLATGVLIIGIGRKSTKKLHTSVFNKKEYKAIIKLGEESTTEDEEGVKKNTNKDNIIPQKEDVIKIIVSFIGETNQTPPLYSAVKIKGKEAYKYARKGEFVKLPSRKIIIENIKFINYNYPFLEILITSSKGVYIRSLARDIGKKLKIGGYLYNLERTRVGDFTVADCVDFSFFVKNKIIIN